MKNLIKINVSGVTASGKTRIALMIKQALMDYNMEVKLNDFDLDLQADTTLRDQMIDNNDGVLKAISDRTEVIITTEQAKRPNSELGHSDFRG